MGDPKKKRKQYDTPRFPWRVDILEKELSLLGQYGLRNKKELWRHQTTVSRFRKNARSLLGMSSFEQKKLEKQLIMRLRRLGILHQKGELDDILDLSTEDILERRLQTLVFRKGLSKTIHQARQLIIHGHIAIGEKRVSTPSYLVLNDEEEKVTYAKTSPLMHPDHLLRKTINVISTSEDKTEEGI
jgi:small subunit ribosomal protein S4